MTRRVGRLEEQRAAQSSTNGTGGGVVFYDPAAGPPALLDTPGNGVVFVLPTKAPPPDPWADMDAKVREVRGGGQCD